MKQLWRFTDLGDSEWHTISRHDREHAWNMAQLALSRYDADSLEIMTLNLQTELLLAQLDTDFDPETIMPNWVLRALFVTAVTGLQGKPLLADITDTR